MIPFLKTPTKKITQHIAQRKQWSIIRYRIERLLESLRSSLAKIAKDFYYHNFVYNAFNLAESFDGTVYCISRTVKLFAKKFYYRVC